MKCHWEWSGLWGVGGGVGGIEELKGTSPDVV